MFVLVFVSMHEQKRLGWSGWVSKVNGGNLMIKLYVIIT